MKKATYPTTLAREEWIFVKQGECPPEELRLCYEYEVAREASRCGHKAAAEGLKIHLVLSAIEDWEHRPWLTLPERLRRRQSGILSRFLKRDYESRKFLAPHACLIGDDGKIIYSRRDILQGEDCFTYFAGAVNWSDSDEINLRRFKAWLVESRKQMEGFPSSGRQRPTDFYERLLALGTYRLLSAYHYKGARSETKRAGLTESCPYGEYNCWFNAATRAKRHLKRAWKFWSVDRKPSPFIMPGHQVF